MQTPKKIQKNNFYDSACCHFMILTHPGAQSPIHMSNYYFWQIKPYINHYHLQINDDFQ